MELSPIPRYLFRVYTPQSDGATDDRWARSRDALHSRRSAEEDIFQTTDPTSTAKRVDHHLRWRRGQRQDNLTSWTSSLLFAVQYTFYRNSSCDDTSSMENIRICIIDTKQLDPSVFIRDMDLMAAFSQFDPSLASLRDFRDRGEHYYGEYLSQGALKIGGRCQSASVQDMCARGLLSLRPEFQEAFGNALYGWALPVVRSRRTLNDAQQQGVNPEWLEVAIRIGCIFGSGWQLPVAINLAALLPGRLDSIIIKNRLVHKQD